VVRLSVGDRTRHRPTTNAHDTRYVPRTNATADWILSDATTSPPAHSTAVDPNKSCASPWTPVDKSRRVSHLHQPHKRADDRDGAAGVRVSTNRPIFGEFFDSLLGSCIVDEPPDSVPLRILGLEKPGTRTYSRFTCVRDPRSVATHRGMVG
jgi:hypothetical protein